MGIKWIKNYEKIKVLIVSCLLLVGGVVSAGVVQDIILEKGKVINIYNTVLTSNDISIVRVNDGVSTCYISYVQYQGRTTNTSISCIK